MPYFRVPVTMVVEAADAQAAMEDALGYVNYTPGGPVMSESHVKEVVALSDEHGRGIRELMSRLSFTGPGKTRARRRPGERH
jgi:hypothetical protein